MTNYSNIQTIRIIRPNTVSGYVSLRRRDRTWSSTKFDFFNDPKNVSRHCGGHYNIKIKHFEHFSGGGGSWSPPSCQVGLRKEKMHLFHSRSPHTIKVYSKVIKRYVKVLRRISNKSYPVAEVSVRKSSTNHHAFTFAQKVSGDPAISFMAPDLLLRDYSEKFEQIFQRNSKPMK